MKNKINILYVIENSPDSVAGQALLDRINQDNKYCNPVTIYIKNDGIQWLHEKYWHNLFKQNDNVVYYANATDARKYNVPFQEGVIFSNPKIFHELLNWADQIYFIH
jgi:hypothetical protein